MNSELEGYCNIIDGVLEAYNLPGEAMQKIVDANEKLVKEMKDVELLRK